MAQKKKPTYKVSASLLNNYLYYDKFPSTESFVSFKNHLSNIFIPNEAIEAGWKYEEEVFAGKHGKISQLLKDLPKQEWANKVIDYDETHKIKISGKMDAIDLDKKIIYDIKKTGTYYKGKYKTSVQHLIYFFIEPRAEKFCYLATTPDGETHIEMYSRPPKEELEKLVMQNIEKLYYWLKSNNMWNVYAENNRTKYDY